LASFLFCWELGSLNSYSDLVQNDKKGGSKGLAMERLNAFKRECRNNPRAAFVNITFAVFLALVCGLAGTVHIGWKIGLAYSVVWGFLLVRLMIIHFLEGNFLDWNFWRIDVPRGAIIWTMLLTLCLARVQARDIFFVWLMWFVLFLTALGVIIYDIRQKDKFKRKIADSGKAFLKKKWVIPLLYRLGLTNLSDDEVRKFFSE